MDLCIIIAREETLPINDLVNLLSSTDTLSKKFYCFYIADKIFDSDDVEYISTNQLIKDCIDHNPGIRSCSISALSSFYKIEDIVLPVLKKSLCDNSPKVRRFAAISCLKYNKDSISDASNGLLDKLYRALQDDDPFVVVNSLIAFNSISKNGFVINETVAYYLLNKLAIFSDSALVYVFHFLESYTCKDEKELFVILNNIDEYFSYKSVAVLVAAVNLFCKWTVNYSNLISDMLMIIRKPILKIMHNCPPEYVYFVINFMLGFKNELLKVLGNFRKLFYLKYRDPYYLKIKKLYFLPYVTAVETAAEVVNEVKPYTTDSNCYDAAFDCLICLSKLSKIMYDMVLKWFVYIIESSSSCVIKMHALESILYVSFNCRIPEYAQHSISRNLNMEIFEKRPALFLLILSHLNFVNVSEYLEKLLNCNLSSETQCLILNTAIKMFTNKPADTQHMLSKILLIFSQSDDIRVRQKTVFIYAALSEGIENVCALFD